MISGPTGFYRVASLLLTDLRPKLELNGELSRVCVYPGPIVWDECECGLLAASLGGIWNSVNFPDPAPPSNCDVGVMVGEIDVQLMGCSPQPQPPEIAPACDVLDAYAQMVISDAWTMFRQVNCTLAGLRDSWEIVEYQMQPLRTAEMGACVGSQVIVRVGINPGVGP